MPSHSTEQLVKRDAKGDVTFLFLARADKRNAMTPVMLTQLLAELDSFSRDCAHKPHSALILAGEGRSFCSGFDLKLCRTNPGTAAELLSLLSRCIITLRGITAPTFIAATGSAIAGAAALCGGADVSIGDRGGVYGYPVLKLGLSPAVSAPFLAAKAGFGNARQMLLDVGLLTGEQAAAKGLLTQCVESPEDVIPRCLKLAHIYASKPRHAFVATKQLLQELDGLGTPEAVAEHVQRALNASLQTADSSEMIERLASL